MRVLKGRYTALIISVVIHLVLLLALVLISAKQQSQTQKTLDQPYPKNQQPKIQSYLYKRPKSKTTEKTPVESKEISQVVNKEHPAIKPLKKEQEIEQEKLTKIIPVEKTLQSETLPKKTIPENKAPVENKTVPQLPDSQPSSLPNKSSTVPTRSNTLHNSLSNLRESINKQLMTDAFNEQTQTRSASIMHAEQIAVPHSDVKLTSEEKYQQNTKTNHAEAITKNDNGTCTIVREQILGSPVEASVSGFSCGESKFDKSFREHMQKVNNKLGIDKK